MIDDMTTVPTPTCSFHGMQQSENVKWWCKNSLDSLLFLFYVMLSVLNQMQDYLHILCYCMSTFDISVLSELAVWS